MGHDRVRWGILGTGDVAGQFAHDVQFVDHAELVAVGSRTLDKAEGFAERYGIRRPHGSYASLAADPEVDAVYVASPHPWHEEHTLLCLRRDKAVLCEKPLALNARQGERVVAEARRRDLFLMEAMWTYFFPAMERVRHCLQEGRLGDIHLVKADFCFRIDYDPAFRLFNMDLGGGALLDVGIYPIALAQLVFQEAPVAVRSVAHRCDTGADDRAALMLEYAGGRCALLTCASRMELEQTAVIAGSDARIEIPRFSQPDCFRVVSPGTTTEERFERSGYGYAYEARHVGECLRQGLRESPVMPHRRSLELLGVMDAARAQWGLRYPMEEAARAAAPAGGKDDPHG
jgi:predicted dehydrogenase